MAVSCSATAYKLIDIGANLTDRVYQGWYYGKSHHAPDLENVLRRSYEAGLDKVIITGGTLSDCKEALDLASKDDHLFTTVGVHPTRCKEFDSTPGVTSDEYIQQLLQLAKSNPQKVVCIGECGLDYDRLKFCGKQTQKLYFERQLQTLSDKTRLPLFLHCRNAFSDFIDIVTRNSAMIHSGGVVHSFDGTLSEAKAYIDFGLYIGLNGCSLKTEDNLSVVRELPLDRLLLETDAPWCEIRPSHASSQFVSTHFSSKKKEHWDPGFSVKSRNEPRNIVQVLEVVSELKRTEKNVVAQKIYENTCTLFNFSNL